MKISVITATYNCGKTLRTTLESVAAQTHPNIEHLVMDGGSKDDTLDLVRGWTAHPLTLETGKDKGIYDALNKGIAKASGEVVGFLHADDVLQDERVLEKIARAFEDPAVAGGLRRSGLRRAGRPDPGDPHLAFRPLSAASSAPGLDASASHVLCPTLTL